MSSSFEQNVAMIPLHLIKTITEEFSEKNRLGKGGYGEVYKGVLNGEEIAVKKLFPVHGLDEEAFINEFRNLMKVQHKNIVRLIGYCYEIAHKHVNDNGQLVFAKVIDRALCFEYMHQGSLSQHLTADSCIHDWPTTYMIIKGTCEAVDYLHRGRGENNYIYHLDLKPDNILLDKNMVPKIGDFGLSRLFGDSSTQQTEITKGTLGFMPPEYIVHRLITPKNDVFSLGVIIFHMMAGEKGYIDYFDLRSRGELSEKGQRFIESVQEYWKKTMQETVGYTLTDTDVQAVTKCIEIAMRCVDDDRDKRPSTREIIADLTKLNYQIEKMPKGDQGGREPMAAVHEGRGTLDVVIVYAFDCTTSTPAWYKVEDVYAMVQGKLAHFADNCLGFIYVMSTPNTYTSDMNLVDSSKTGYTESSARRRANCTKNMASGLPEARKLMRGRRDLNGIILLFSDGLVNKGDFFDGAVDFNSEVPVYTFTLGGDGYNYGLQAIAKNSQGGTFIPLPVPDRPTLSVPFSRQLDSILNGTAKDDEMHPSSNSGRCPVDVVIVYAFDCTTSTPAWYTVEDIYALVQGKLSKFGDSCLGFTYVMSTPNTYTSDMILVECIETGYTNSSARNRDTCMKNMAAGLTEAHKLISYRGQSNSIILLFSDGLINKGDFFDGAEEFISKVPVHTFTLGGDAYNYGLRAMARNSPGGAFSPFPVPNKPSQSVHFSRLLDSILNNTTKDDEKGHSPNSGRLPLDVVIVYAFDCTYSTQDWGKVNYVYKLVQEKLTQFADSCLGFTYVMSTPNTYVSDINFVDSSNTGYTKSSARKSETCMKNMSSGLPEAHRLITEHGNLNGVILLFSDGVINKGDFFDGAEDFISKVPVHTFTLGGDAYNDGLRTIASKSPGGTFSPLPVTDLPPLSVPFLRRLDSILNGTTRDEKEHPCTDSGRWPLDVVIVYAFDSTTSTPAWVTLEDVYSMVQGKLLHCKESCIGFTYVMLTPNTCTSDMNFVHDIVTTGYKHGWARSRTDCTKNMACGLPEAHKLISYRGHWNSKILLFSDGLIHKGDFFDGAEDYISKVPVHTFTLGGDAYNHVLRSMADNSSGGKFHPIPVPAKPILSEDFSHLLDSILGDDMEAS